MNTKLVYMYRDGANYKEYANVVLSGSLNPTQIKEIWESVGGEVENGFIPYKVGLPHLSPVYDVTELAMKEAIDQAETEESASMIEQWDHPFHELFEITETKDEADQEISAQDFYKKMVAHNFKTQL